MQMQDALRHVRGGAALADLAAAFAITPEQARTISAVVGAEFARRLEQHTLSRGGLADLTQVVGRSAPAEQVATGSALLRSPAALAEGKAILGDLLLGSKEQSRAVAARAARRAGVGAKQVEDMLPALALLTMASLAARSSDSIKDLYARMPPLGRLSAGSAHADIAGVIRRGCGSGPYGPMALRHLVRNVLARAGDFRPRGALFWYVTFLLRPLRIGADRLGALFRRGF
jgi:hypothetical protein